MLRAARVGLPRATCVSRAVLPASRYFSGYDGVTVRDEDLVKGAEDWAIEETNFCLGRVGMVRYKETDDLYRRTQKLIDSQFSRMHTRLRDGTCIAVTSLVLTEMIDHPGPAHIFTEQPLLKYTWDETYDEAYEPPVPRKK
mmetsp:Transcript_3688/g.7701  ORF Transcript_3688/g.7701 Transcript_3688/m.7701 type:complete len:141 (+) Transcript_3688:38-460(+)